MKVEGRSPEGDIKPGRSGYLSFILYPSVFIFFFLVANSAGFLFHQPYYEMWDLAANSLSVERAKHFAEWYGPYSRWGFHHPGPASFYALAWGEWLFRDVLRLTPTPYNAQVLTQLCISTVFYAAAVAVFARRLTQRAGAWFWPLAILAGAVHFGFASRLPSYDFLRGPSVFASTWSAHQIVLPFLCLLTAGASVAAGHGEDVPLLAVAAGMLLHLHVAQPLFVLPLTMLAIFGLVRGGTWRAFRASYAVAGLVAAVFALPLGRDLFRGADSNLVAILHHLRTHHGEHQSFVKSLLYFLQFGAYAPYQPGRLDFGHFDGAGALGYLRTHAAVLAGWLLAGLAVTGIAVRPRPDPEGRGHFLVWGGRFLLVGIVLTLYWGTIQDGEMFYYNAWLNFALYYFGLLIVIAALSARLDALPFAWPVRLMPAAVAVVVCVLLADRWRVRDPVPETTARLHESMARVLEATPPGDAVFEFTENTWPVAVALGLEMTRAGRLYEVGDRWINVFGREHAASQTWRDRDNPAPVPWRFRTGPGTVPWRGDDPGTLDAATRRAGSPLLANPGAASDFPLPDDIHLDTRLLALSMRGEGPGAEINFQTGGDVSGFMLLGWSDPEPWGTWTEGHRSILRFRPDRSVDDNGGGVELTVELHPFLAPAAGLTAQRVQAWFNGVPLGPPRRIAADPPPAVWMVPAVWWNLAVERETGAALEFTLPDAASPSALDPTGRAADTRLLGVGVSRVRFRAVPP